MAAGIYIKTDGMECGRLHESDCVEWRDLETKEVLAHAAADRWSRYASTQVSFCRGGAVVVELRDMDTFVRQRLGEYGYAPAGASA